MSPQDLYAQNGPAPGVRARRAGTVLALAALLIVMGLGPPAAAQTMEWNNAAGGNWNTATNWTPNNVPDAAGESAVVPASMAPAITLNISPSFDWLDIQNASTVFNLFGETLTTTEGFTNAGMIKAYDGTATINGDLINLAGGSIRLGASDGLYLGGPNVINDGEIVLNYEQSWSAVLTCAGGITLSGSGTLSLAKAGADARLETLPDCSLTQLAGHTILGCGRINAAFTNEGLVDANVTGVALELLTNPKENSGTLKASSGGYLDITGTTVTQTGLGEIVADAGTVRLEDGATVIGGTLSSINGGALYSASGANTLQDVSLSSGSWVGITGDTGPLYLTGTAFTNDGTLVINHNRSWSSTLSVNSNLTLDGIGEVVLNDDGTDAQLKTAEGMTLTNSAAHTIRGYGQLHAALINDGDVAADVATKVLELRTNAKTNNASMRAAEGAYLDLYGHTLTQSGTGQLLADGAGASVRLRGDVTVSGGTLASTNGGGLYSYEGANTLDNATLAEGSWMGILGSTGPLHLTGTTLTNDGSLVVNYNRSWSSTLIADSNLTLEGSGEVVLNDDGTDAQLTTADGVVLTQDADHTIRGYGQLHAALVNDGTVSADVPLKSLELRTNAKTNNAWMKATGGGYLDLYGFTLTQSPAGEVLAEGAGSAVHLRSGTIISGGSLTSTTDAAIYSDSGANTLDNAELSSGSWLGVAGDSGPLNLTGTTFTNDGTVVVNHNQSWTSSISVNSDLTVQGGGAIVLNDDDTDAQLNTAGGVTLTQAAGHTIRGFGRVNADLVNNGTVAADVAGKALELYTNPKTNNALMQATAGAYLDLYSHTLTQSPTGVLLASGTAAGVRLRGGATVAGGTLASAAGGGLYSHDGANTLEDVTLALGSWLGIRGSTGPLYLTGSTFTNHGTMEVNYNKSWSATLSALSDVTMEGIGEVRLSDDDADAQLTTAEGMTLTNALEHTIDGYGQIHAALINEGDVVADVAAKALELRTNAKTNEGSMSAIGGAYLDLYGITLTQSPAAQLLADGAGSQVRLRGGVTVNGGTLASTNEGALYSYEGVNTLENATLAAGAWMGLRGSTGPLNLIGETFTNHGSLVVNYNRYWSGVLSINSNLTMQGSGEVVLNDDDTDARLNTAAGVVLTNDIGHTIRGYGQINAAIDNLGTIDADSTSRLTLNPVETGIVNHGLMRVSGSGGMTINSPLLFVNESWFVIDPTRTLTVSGGTYRQANGTTTVNGAIAGTVSIETGVLEGTGTVSGSVTNTGGDTAPGESIGTLTINGSFTQQPQARVTIEIGGIDAGTFDVLDVNGTANFYGGTLDLVLVDDYLPAEGDTITPITYNAHSGMFSSISGMCTENGMVWRLSYGVTGLTITAEADECPISIVGSDPPNFAIDARQPTNVDGTGVFGFDEIAITFDGDTAGLTPADFTVSTTDGTVPVILAVISDGNVATLELDVPIPPGEWTTFLHNASQTRSTLGYLPGDVNGDATSAAPDLLSLIDFLNGVRVLPIYSTDLDRTGLAAPQDVLRLIDLLNGAGAFDPWLGVSLPPPPGT